MTSDTLKDLLEKSRRAFESIMCAAEDHDLDAAHEMARRAKIRIEEALHQSSKKQETA